MKTLRIFAGFSALLLVAACDGAEPVTESAGYEQGILEWRAGRLERLLAPTGYLNQVALYWVEPGTYSFGSGADNDVVFPPNAPASIGTFEVGDEGIDMRVNEGVEVLHGTERVTEIAMISDADENTVMVSLGSLAWSVIDREGKLAIRVRDYDHPFVRDFGPLPYYDIDPSYRVQALLKRYDEPRIANVGTVIEGLGYHPMSPGVVAFELGGKTYELEAYASGDKLFFVFGDETNRGETYGAGRFLYAEQPGPDGKTVLDFNKAYSPPCAFNDFSTCPVASPRNRLPVRVTAGEKYEPRLYFSGHQGG
ncbi:MAG TPA: DUF1684 domain-containing protein [Woeseiaceae bacterium]